MSGSECTRAKKLGPVLVAFAGFGIISFKLQAVCCLAKAFRFTGLDYFG